MKRLLLVLSLACKPEVSPPPPASTVSAPKVESSAAFDSAVHKALPHYLAVQEALAADTVKGVPEAAHALAAALGAADASAVTGPGAPLYRAIVAEGPAAAREAAEAKEIAAARDAFKKVSKLLAPWAVNARPTGIEMVWCSMAPGGWLQKAGPIRNPYYGAGMLECGEKQS